MLCAQRLQRILMAIVLGVVLYFFAMGQSNPAMFQIGVVLQFVVMVMVLVWAFTDFCPSLWAFKKAFGDCDFAKKS